GASRKSHWLGELIVKPCGLKPSWSQLAPRTSCRPARPNATTLPTALVNSVPKRKNQNVHGKSCIGLRPYPGPAHQRDRRTVHCGRDGVIFPPDPKGCQRWWMTA